MSVYLSLHNVNFKSTSAQVQERKSMSMYSLIRRFGMRPSIEVVDIIVPDFLSSAENLFTVHAKSLVVQAEMFGLQSFRI